MRTIIAAVAAIAVAGTAAIAQQKAPAEATAFAKKVASANTFEIQSSELSRERARSADVKGFAEQMIADHTKAGQDFKAAVQTANVSPPPPEEPDAKQNRCVAVPIECGDNEVEQLKFWEDASQVWKIPSGDEDELPPGAPDFFQSLDGGHIHAAVAGQGSVVVGG